MESVMINLNSIDDAKRFVELLFHYEGEFDLVSGRYIVDAKSMMGIFSLDLSKPIQLDIHKPNEEIIAKLREFQKK